MSERSLRSQRKLDHLRLAPHTRSGASGFADVTLVHASLPELAYAAIDLRTELAGLPVSMPLMINAMTGGVAEAEPINRSLGRLARAFSIPVAVGSQRAAFADHALTRTYSVVREENPSGVVIANLGAGATPDEAEDAVAMLSADLLQLHLNAPQEMAMAEGDRDFRGQLHAIERVRNRLKLPVIVKECGFGMSRETARTLWAAGIRIVDIAGHGGTNFARVETIRKVHPNHRGVAPDPALMDWGIPTVASLWEVAGAHLPDLQVIASGGVRYGSDVAKSLAMGAQIVGIAGPVLAALEAGGYAAAESFLQAVRDDLATTCLLAGAANVRALSGLPTIVTGITKSWIDQRSLYFAAQAPAPA